MWHDVNYNKLHLLYEAIFFSDHQGVIIGDEVIFITDCQKKRTLVDLIFVHNYPDGDILSLQIIVHNNNNNGIILMVMFSLCRKLSSSLSYSEEDCFVLGWKPSFTF